MDFKTIIFKVLQFTFAIFLGIFAIRLLAYHLALVTFPFSVGLREGAMMTSTNALVHHLNPYDMSLQPRLMNQYGIIYPLLVWPWAKLFGTTILIHRMVTAFSILASCILIFFVLIRMNVPYLLNFWAVLMLYSSLLYPGTSTPTIDPGATGTFFLLLTIFIPWLCKYSYRSLLISVICGILAFYTKLYTFLGALIMLSYLFLFISKRKGLIYGFLLLTLLSISIVMVDRVFPAYFDNCFFAAINMGPAWSSIERLQLQIHMYSGMHQWTLILMGIFILWYGFKNIRAFLKEIASSSSMKSAGLLAMTRPDDVEAIGPFDTIKFKFPLVLYAGICSAIVLYVSLGRHNGAMLWYFFQLLSPFLLIGAAWLFSRHNWWPVLCIPLLILNLHTMTADQNYKIFDKKMPGWSEISTLISQHQHILNIALIAPLLVEQNKEVYDDGQAEYFGPGGYQTKWKNITVHEDPRVSYQLYLYFDNLRKMVENKQFDLIILQPTLLPLGVGDDIKKFYKCEGGLMLYAPQDKRLYAVSLWLPL